MFYQIKLLHYPNVSCVWLGLTCIGIVVRVTELIPLLLEAFGQKLQWADNFNASVVNYAKIATPE
jgi:hypothetical protein